MLNRFAACAVLGLSVALLLSFRAGAQADPAQDAVEMIGPGSLTNIKVLTDNWIMVEAQRFQVKTPIPAYRVRKVVYSAAPDLYRVAQTAAEEGDYERALRALILTLRERGDAIPWFKQYILYDIARFYVKHAGEGSYEKARGYLDQLFKDVPDSRFTPEALLLYADTFFLEAQDFEKARQAYDDAAAKLAQMAGQVSGDHVDYLQEKSFLAKYKAGECLMLLKRFGEAKSVFEGVAARSRKYPRIYYLALLGKSQSLWQEGQIDKALEDFASLIEAAEVAGVRDILAGAYAGLGDCYFEKKEYEEARWNYLKVVVQFFDAQEYAAKALYRVGLCYREIMNRETDAKKRQEAGKMARYYFDKVVADYEGYWADQARDAAKTL